METYVAFLRGINVGGRNKIPMLALREALSTLNVANVRTYIQSGNVLFESKLTSKRQITDLIHDTIKTNFGFEIPVLVLTKVELATILSNCPYADKVYTNSNKTYFLLLFKVPKKELNVLFEEMVFENEIFQVSDSCVYLLCNNGYGKAKLNNNIVESKLKVTATARNYRTILKVLELA
jgi:uncharacterized protein (DUF1697 family)